MNITNNYNDLPLGKYIKILALAQDENASDMDTQVRVLAILTDLSESEILNLPIATFKELVMQSMFLATPAPTTEASVCDVYEIGGFELIPCKRLEKITTAQYIDFQAYSKEGMPFLPEMLSCFLVPRGKKYNDGYDIVEVQKAVRECIVVSEALKMAAFFLSRYLKLMRSSLTYSERILKRTKKNEARRTELEKEITRCKAILQRGGDGLIMSMQ